MTIYFNVYENVWLKFYYIQTVVDAFDGGEMSDSVDAFDAFDSRDENEFVDDCVCGGESSPVSTAYSPGNERICGVLRSEVMRLFNKN